MTPFELKVVEYAKKIQAKAEKGTKKRGRPALAKDKQEIIFRLRSFDKYKLTLQDIAAIMGISMNTAFKYADRACNARRTPGHVTLDRQRANLITKSPRIRRLASA
jgi:hypothetical protein